MGSAPLAEIAKKTIWDPRRWRRLKWGYRVVYQCVGWVCLGGISSFYSVAQKKTMNNNEKQYVKRTQRNYSMSLKLQIAAKVENLITLAIC